MAVSFPLADLMDVIQEIEPLKLFERQEYSRAASGVTYGKSLGSSLWMGSWTTKPMRHDDALDFEARLNTLDGVINTFYGEDVRRRYPKMYPNGTFDESAAAIHTLDTDGQIRIDGLPAGFVISRGDYFHFDYGTPTNRALHQASETVVCDGAGLSPLFEVRPHIRQGAEVDLAVSFKRPRAIFTLEPDSISKRVVGMLHSQVSWKGVQAIV